MFYKNIILKTDSILNVYGNMNKISVPINNTMKNNLF